jgi:hypothetical protein
MQCTLPDEPMHAMDIFYYVREMDCYPNASIAYHILFLMLDIVHQLKEAFQS